MNKEASRYNPFKAKKKELPKLLKTKVINDTSRIKLAIDLVDLFTIKFSKTMVEVFY